jgi:hypothetical protein
MTVKERLHLLVDTLPEREEQTAARLLELLHLAGDPLLRALLDAPEDDEPESDQERAAVAEGWAALRSGDVVSDHELRRELGL